MSEIKEVNIECNSGGKISFSNDVIATIVSRAVVDIEGIASAGGNIVNSVSEFFGAKNQSKGVKVEVGEEEVVVDMVLAVKYGVNIPTVCSQVRKNIEDAVLNMTGLRVKEVNISIANIISEKE